MKCLVTGSAGYVGRILHRRLRELGHEVVGVDRRHSGYTVPGEDKDEFVQVWMDLAEAEVNPRLPKEHYDAVFHLAASSLLGPSVDNPEEYFLNNVGSTAKLLQGLHSCDFKGVFIFASSAAVYGDRTGDCSEDDPLAPINPYGATKVACEELIEAAAKRDKYSALAFRFFNVAGSYTDLTQDVDQPHVLTSLSRSAFNGDPFTINGYGLDTKGGTCQRSYVHVLDVVEAMIQAAEYHDENGPTLGTEGWERKPVYFDAFNVGVNESHGVMDLVRIFSEENDTPVMLNFGPARPGDPKVLKPSGGYIKLAVYYDVRFSHSSIEEIVRSHSAGIFEKLAEQIEDGEGV